MADARSDHQALRLPDGSVLIFGGECDPGTNQDAILDSVDRFDPADESFHAWPALLVPRDDSRIAMLLDGRILVTGGEDVKTHSIPDAELYPVPRAVRGPGSGIMRGGR
jgi:hypothetical protein